MNRPLRRGYLAATAVALAATAVSLLTPALVHAQGGYFGRNKVQYKPFDFSIIKTEHFDVYYYPVEREAAMDAARMVERSYGRLSRVLQHEFDERKPVIVYASHTDFQQTNALQGESVDESTGGVTEALKSRMIMPFTGSYADFDHVMTHELVHGFQYDVMFRHGAASDVNPFMVRLPFWFMEGMAEYVSIGSIDAHTQSWLRDAVLNGYLRNINEMNQRDDYLSYRFGQSLWSYIGAKWGDEVIGMLLDKAPRMGVERAFSTTLGMTLGDLSTEWENDVRKTYLTQVTEHSQPQTFAEKLTKHDKMYDPWYLSPAISPDGTQMVYLSQREGFSIDMWLADAHTGKVFDRLISSSKNADFESLRYMTSSAAFSNDGNTLTFVAKSGGEDALYLYDLKKRKVTKKLKFGFSALMSPTFSPDGQEIAFTALVGGISDLFITDLKGEHLKRLTNDRYAELLPAWSPDGRTIAITTDRGPGTNLDQLKYSLGHYEIALLDVATGQIQSLPHQNAGKNINAVWSPDGSKLIWVNDRTGVNNLYLYDLKTTELSQITDLISGVIAVGPLSPVLAWSSRTGRLLFGHFEAAGYNIYAVNDPLTLPRTPVIETSTAIATSNVQQGASSQTPNPAVSPATTKQDPNAPASSYYRNGKELRESDVLPAGTTVAAPVSVAALIDSATISLPDTTDFTMSKYKVKFTADVIGRPQIGAQVGGYYGNGVTGGTYVQLSDMLGNHNIVIAGNLSGSLSDASIFTGYSYLKSRTNFGFALSQQPMYRYAGSGIIETPFHGDIRTVNANVYQRDVFRSGQIGASYPFSPYSRVELAASGIDYNSQELIEGYDLETGEVVTKTSTLGRLTFAQPEAAFVFDNTLFGYTGPIVGRRYRIALSQTVGDVKYSQALLDFRNYANYKTNLVLATRFVGLRRMGSQADRFGNYWGSSYFLRGYDYNSFDNNSDECINSKFYGSEQSQSFCPVRDQLIGSNALLLNTELRYPIIKELQIGFLGNFPPVDAVAFFDGGLAWDNKVCNSPTSATLTGCTETGFTSMHVVWDRKPGQDPYLYREPLFSYGLGLRINVFYTVLRLDWAWAPNRPDHSNRFSLGFGPSF
jgi:Tol biopolymer transport system component